MCSITANASALWECYSSRLQDPPSTSPHIRYGNQTNLSSQASGAVAYSIRTTVVPPGCNFLCSCGSCDLHIRPLKQDWLPVHTDVAGKFLNKGKWNRQTKLLWNLHLQRFSQWFRFAAFEHRIKGCFSNLQHQYPPTPLPCLRGRRKGRVAFKRLSRLGQARLRHVFGLRTGALFFFLGGSKGAVLDPPNVLFFAVPEFESCWGSAVSQPCPRRCFCSRISYGAGRQSFYTASIHLSPTLCF